MTARLYAFALTAALLTAATSLFGAAESPSMDDFPLLGQRNIFDPTRQPYRRPAPRVERPPRPEAPRRESLNLTGSIVRPDKSYAFFSGSDPDYNRIVSPQDRVEEFLISEITTTNVVLQVETNRWVLPVGRQMVREGDRPWALGGAAAPTAASSSNAGPGPGGTSDAGASGAAAAGGDTGGDGGGMSDVMKRLMERRQQELNQ